eukprot:CAMPEP_0182438836 /NCGR_PEP_ID=MMETSP1167-20130531/86051_1 /TAXON_ID=2988 /ORGANISM="Mallomonas Sp, Strain CCMP3275" /LENGTH=217 /DNA_ID=CAMNT_0024632365 /DNA_START=199 /DNA_END=849 /DNA_ORIENTATION=-
MTLKERFDFLCDVRVELKSLEDQVGHAIIYDFLENETEFITDEEVMAARQGGHSHNIFYQIGTSLASQETDSSIHERKTEDDTEEEKEGSLREFNISKNEDLSAEREMEELLYAHSISNTNTLKHTEAYVLPSTPMLQAVSTTLFGASNTPSSSHSVTQSQSQTPTTTPSSLLYTEGSQEEKGREKDEQDALPLPKIRNIFAIVCDNNADNCRVYPW